MKDVKTKEILLKNSDKGRRKTVQELIEQNTYGNGNEARLTKRDKIVPIKALQMQIPPILIVTEILLKLFSDGHP